MGGDQDRAAGETDRVRRRGREGARRGLAVEAVVRAAIAPSGRRASSVQWAGPPTLGRGGRWAVGERCAPQRAKVKTTTARSASC